MQNNVPTTDRIPNMTPPQPSEPQQPVNRACESCRLLKVRCLPDETSASGICQRCSKSGRHCVFAAPQKRRQRKRTDTRVAELEKEVRAMRLLLEKGNTKSIPEEPEEDRYSEESDEHDVGFTRTGQNGPILDEKEDEVDMGMGASSSSQPQTPNDDLLSLTSQSSLPAVRDRSYLVKDVIDRGIVSAKVANELFASYNNHLVQHYPAVLLPPTSTASELRRSHPALFLAVICAACCNYDDELYIKLFDENTRLFAERIFMNGEKSLELVQALTITSVWYCPPVQLESVKTLRFYQFIHMAATMALDIGLGTQVDMSAMSLDKSRTICACYLNCASIAMRMRRPNMLRWTSWMSQCLELLEKSPVSSFLDQRLAAWVRLQIITDDYANFFSFEDPSTTINLADSRMQVTLKGFERQLEDWKRNTPSDILNESLVMAYHQNSIYLHERIAIDGNFDEDFNHRLFKPPQAIASVLPALSQSGPLNAAYINAVMMCIESMHSLIDVFLSLDLLVLRTVPIVVYVRMSYSVVVLIKIYISTCCGKLGSALDRKFLKVAHYLEACMEKVKVAAGGRKYRVPGKWLSILREINEWYRKYELLFTEDDVQLKNDSDVLERNQLVEKGQERRRAQVNATNHLCGMPVIPFVHQGATKGTVGDSTTLAFSAGDQSEWPAPDNNWVSRHQTNSSQTGGFDPFGMDFAANDLQFHDQIGGLDGTSTWMTDSMVLGDINFDVSGGDWSTQFMNT